MFASNFRLEMPYVGIVMQFTRSAGTHIQTLMRLHCHCVIDLVAICVCNMRSSNIVWKNNTEFMVFTV